MKTTTNNQATPRIHCLNRAWSKLSVCMAGGLLLFTAACNKENTPAATASLTVINTVTGSDILVASFKGTQPLTSYARASMIAYGAYYNNVEASFNNQFNAYSGTQPLALYNYPDTTVPAKPLFNLQLSLPAGTINSLFLTGAVALPDTLFTVDHPPYHPIADSSMGVRFVNLSPGSTPVNINLQGQANGSEAGSLSYKGITGFKNYPVVSTVSSYVFEFRNAANGDLLATYTAAGINQLANGFPNKWSHKNFTLAFYGPATDPLKQAVLCINNN